MSVSSGVTHPGSWYTRSCEWRAERQARRLRWHTASWGRSRGSAGPACNCNSRRRPAGTAPERERERETLLEARTDERNPRITIQIVFTLHLLKCQWPALFDGAESWDHLERFVSETLQREREREPNTRCKKKRADVKEKKKKMRCEFCR